ncbi:MAG: Holliday junction branch migration protein RuvA [Nostocoides sp.]
MIASVRGEVQHVGLDRVVIVVGGVGMLVHTTPGTAASCRLGATTDLATTLVVREDSLTLYGFESAEDRDMFESVQTVTGVGPRLALAMLSVLTPDQLRAAVSRGDLVTLTKVPGVGKRVAERLALELRDKLGPPSHAGSGTAAAGDVTPGSSSAWAAGAWREQVGEALTGLGWSAKQAETALDKVGPAPDEPVDIAAVLRAALRELGR